MKLQELLFFLSGIETEVAFFGFRELIQLLFFLSGIETSLLLDILNPFPGYYSSYQALKLPFVDHFIAANLSYYSSYQALKRLSSEHNMNMVNIVTILPIRH